jgi:hypothetical protein
MQLAIVFVVVGVLLTLATSIFRQSRPRRAGDPLGPVRAVLLSMGLIGWLCVLIGAALLFTG